MSEKIKITSLWEAGDLEIKSNGLSGSNFTATGQTATLRYLVEGAADESDACRTVFNAAPERYEDMPKATARIAERSGKDTWKVEVSYSRKAIDFGSSGDKESDTTQSFECSAGTAHINMAISQKRIYGTQNGYGLIGWHGPGSNQVDGVDVVVPVMRETYTKKMGKKKLNSSYRRTISALTGTVNASKFKGWDAGEVLFLGASFSISDEENKATVTYQFAIIPNGTTPTMPNGQRYTKKGHDYLSVLTEKKGTGQQPITAAYINQVYPYKDFSPLGL